MLSLITINGKKGTNPQIYNKNEILLKKSEMNPLFDFLFVLFFKEKTLYLITKKYLFEN